MSAIETRDLLQKIVLWPFVSYDSYGGFIVGPAHELSARWSRNRRETIDAQGTKIALDATVVVAQKIIVGSLVWLGELADWLGTGSAGDDSELMQVATYSETPDLRNKFIRREIGLVRYKDSV